MFLSISALILPLVSAIGFFFAHGFWFLVVRVKFPRLLVTSASVNNCINGVTFAVVTDQKCPNRLLGLKLGSNEGGET